MRAPLLPLLGLAAALALHAAPASAQIVEVGTDGGFTETTGPAIASDDGFAITVADPGGAWPDDSAQPAARSATLARSPATGTLDQLFAAAAREARVDLRLVRAVAWQESRFRHTALSPRGAIGIMQLMPGTASALGVDPRDVRQNIRGGAFLLARLLSRYRGDLDLALAAYNAGEGAVQRWRGVPPTAETIAYVAGVKRSLMP